MLRGLWELAFQNLLVKALHVLCLEGRFERDHFIDDTAQTPDVTLNVVWLVFPDFWRSVIRRASLSVVESLLVCNLADVHVSQLCLHIVVQENVGTFQIPVHDLDFVHGVKPPDHLNEYLPDLPFFDVSLVFLVVADLLEDITVVG